MFVVSSCNNGNISFVPHNLYDGKKWRFLPFIQLFVAENQLIKPNRWIEHKDQFNKLMDAPEWDKMDS